MGFRVWGLEFGVWIGLSMHSDEVIPASTHASETFFETRASSHLENGLRV